MAVVLMRQKFKAISVMQLYFLETQQSSFLCQPFYQEVKSLFSGAPSWKPDKLANAPKGQTDLLTGGKRKNTSCGLKPWHERFSGTQSSRERRLLNGRTLVWAGN